MSRRSRSSGRTRALSDWYTAAAGLREAYETDPEAREVIDTARGLEGLRRQDSIHAAAVVISPVPLTDIVPIQRKGDDAEVVTQYEMHGVEALGLLKMDFLGLRNLSTIERALELIERTTGERVDIDAIPLDDPMPSTRCSKRGDSMGVFQFEGGPMRALMRNLQARALRAPRRPQRALSARAARARACTTSTPTARTAVRRSTIPTPTSKTILADTFGIMVYQEQVMQVAAANGRVLDGRMPTTSARRWARRSRRS